MPMISKMDLRKAFLEILSRESHAHKFALIGRGEYQRGALETHLSASFSVDDRALADQVLSELRRDGYVQPTYRDMAEPENWIVITDSGRIFLQRDLADRIDLHLREISPHLVELRHGMLDAVERTSPDAPRQAAHSARELLDQLLKEGAPPECQTRRERFRFLMSKDGESRKVSSSDLAVIEAHWKVVEAEHAKILAAAHSRHQVHQNDVRASVLAAERILGLIFGSDD
jgi:DNA-binding PadR family transcriptional regulator